MLQHVTTCYNMLQLQTSVTPINLDTSLQSRSVGQGAEGYENRRCCQFDLISLDVHCAEYLQLPISSDSILYSDQIDSHIVRFVDGVAD